MTTLPNVETAKLSQKAVLWPFVRYEKGGDVVVGTPSEICVRWEDVLRYVRGPERTPIATNATIYVDQQIALGGKIWLGELKYLPTNPDRRNILFYEEIPNLEADAVQRTIYAD